MIPHVSSGGAAHNQDYLTTLKGFQQSSDKYNIERLTWYYEDCLKNWISIMKGKIEGFAMDSKTMMRDKSEDDTQCEKS
jgi:hypothetical protein